MKIIYTLVFLLLLGYVARAQYVTIPDDNFRNFLRSKYPGCFNGAQELNTSCTAITTEDSLEFHGIGPLFPAMNIDGIQYFTSLVYLNCSNTFIAACPALPSSLKYFNFSFTNVSMGDAFLPVLPDGLEKLVCTDNILGSLPSSFPSSLKYLDCSNNYLSTINNLPALLDTLICSNQTGDPVTHVMRTLPALPAGLKYLDCSSNGLSALTNLPAGLQYLNCSNQNVNINPESYRRTLSTLSSLPSSLTYLNCSDNCLTSINALPASLQYLNCSNQFNLLYDNSGFNYVQDKTLQFLPFLPPTLNYLNCTNNALQLLPGLPDALTSLYCKNNLMNCMEHLPAQLSVLEYDADRIACLPNSCIAAPAPVICTPANDPNRCLPYPVITGLVFTDNNMNGIKDANEYPRSNVKLLLSNGAFTFSDNNGYYSLSPDSTGAYTVSVVAPPFYTALPPSANYNFTSYDTTLIRDFSLQPTVLKDSLSIHISNVNSIARPGGKFAYNIYYENPGTTNSNTTVILHYDNVKLQYDSCSNNNVSHSGNSIELPANLTAGQSGQFTVYFSVSTSALAGQLLQAAASIVSGQIAGTDSNTVTIRASLDPNDKQATEQLTPAQVAAGAYVEYTIRFQNTGNDTAFNIVISDVLDNKLLTGSFELIHSSHPCRAFIKQGVMYFDFKNISLPDSNVNEVKSHGLIQYRIKPVSTIALNSVIENQAAIYFDYNSPVITNNALTVIKEPGEIFRFTGNGNWNVTGNWKNNLVPPSVLVQGQAVIIDPPINGKCTLNIPVTVQTGASLIVQPKKQLIINGNLTVQ